MADELDPRLEARLREALRAEADALPFTVNEQDVLRERDRRGHRRWAPPASLLGAAAVVTLLVVAGAIWRATLDEVAASPSASPSAWASPRPLATYDELTRMLDESLIVPWTVAAQGEGPAADAGDGKITTVLGTVGVHHFIDFALDCTGGDIEIRVMSGDSAGFGYKSACGPRPIMITDGMGSADPDSRVEVVATKDVRWRVIVQASAPASGEPSVAPSLPPVPALGFDSTLRGVLHGSAGPSDVTTLDAPVAPGSTIAIAFACWGGGLVHLTVDGVAEDAACVASNSLEFVPGGGDRSVVMISANQVVLLDMEFRSYTPAQKGEPFTPPVATLSNGSDTTTGVKACGGDLTLPGGQGKSDDCSPRWLAVPEARALHVPINGAMVATLPDGWTITDVTATYVPNADTLPPPTGADGAQLGSSAGGGPAGFTMPAPPAGDWAVRAVISGKAGDGTLISFPYIFRVMVGQ
jgi:hypothetical protein